MTTADFVYDGCGHVGTEPPLRGDNGEYCGETCRSWFEPNYEPCSLCGYPRTSTEHKQDCTPCPR